MKLFQLKIVALFMLTIFGVKVNAKFKPVIASLSTKWKNTPIIHEASEFVAEESNENFWKFVDIVVSFQMHQSETSARELHDAAVKAATMAIGNDDLRLSLFKFALGLRMYSPKIEMFDQLAKHNAPDCELFFDVHGSITCNPDEIEGLVSNVKETKANPSSTFQTDHIYPATPVLPIVVILYGDMMSQNFKQAHETAKRLSEKELCKYVLRHYTHSRPEEKAKLSGYGVELAIKSTEYKASDDSQVKDENEGGSTTDEKDIEIDGFDFAALRHLHPNLSSELTDFRNYLIDSTNEMQPMKVWQLQDLSFQGAARVLNSPPEDQLQVLQDISQNFPLRVRSLVKQQVSEELRKEIKRNQQMLDELNLDPGESLFLLNGMQIDFSDTDMFELLDLLRTEGKLISGLKKLNIHGNDLNRIIKLNINSETEDNYLLDFRDSSIIWANDIEEDEKYQRWPSNLHELLRPAFPGTMRRVRKNMFHLVFVIDPLHEDAKHLVEAAEIYWANDVPLRIGFSFLVNDEEEVSGLEDAGVALVRAYNYARDELDDNGKSLSFLAGIYKSLLDDEELTVNHIKSRIQKKFKSADVDDILDTNSDYDENRKEGKAFHTRSGLSGPINVLFNGELLPDNEITLEDIEQSVVERILEGFPFLQRATYMGHLTNDMNVLDFVMERPNVVPRFNERIQLSKTSFLDLVGDTNSESFDEIAEEFPRLNPAEKTAALSKSFSDRYLTKSDRTKHVRPVTMWIVADLQTPEGRNLLYSALKHVKSSSLSRVGVVHNPTRFDEGNKESFANLYEVASKSMPEISARSFITKIVKEDNAKKISKKSGYKSFLASGTNEKEFESLLESNKETISHLKAHANWARSVLKLTPGQRAVVANGKMFGPLFDDENFTPEDFHLMESMLHSSATEEIQEALRKMPLEPPEMSDLIMKMTAHLLSQPKVDTVRRDLSPPYSEHSVLKVSSTAGDSSAYDIMVVMDPATHRAQEIIPIVLVLQKVLDANVRIYMNCREKLSDLPVKRFYRFVLEPQMSFKVDNTQSDGPIAKFVDMPSKSLLTLNLHPPEGWMVEAVNAVYDLDNIKLEEVSSKMVSAFYELEYLVLEGHAKDLTTGSPPRGLQFTLGETPDTVAVDTIVMANLGYFQLKANPGVWYLNLREGKSRDIYQISSHEHTDSAGDDVIILMDSFKSKIIIVKVAKKSDKLEESLLDKEEEKEEPEDTEGGGLWNSFTSTFSGGSREEPTQASGNSSDVINIFSLASGHLYERLMRIMMLSVMSKTNTRVKFWVLKNYLSPQFKDFIPYMAEKYGFEYELVQYKWPRWLRQQTEKQRTMWGYKILFLDVLFPLGVDKIIFVDADQIVRADLKELRDLDLEGNPYGYTPFCDDRKEMDGFRFWKGGYWASHLAGRKYHISAIYVVDLKKFRQIAAGDRLRGQYQGLSQDPNSLANLDQDLPNNMIHQVGIKSLPQEWLWCATWCSEESKARAKTIDLCNNPLTKEPKLQAAVRIAPEWTSYDEEIKALQVQFSENKTQPKQDSPHDTEPKRPHEEL